MVGQRYTQKRFYSWSADIAYCVGLMASDGWLSRDGRHLSLTSVDLEQLDNFCKALGKDIKVATKKSGAGTWAYHVQFSDVAFYDFLLEAGITPAKSHTIGKINIPDEYYFSFLRGVLVVFADSWMSVGAIASCSILNSRQPAQFSLNSCKIPMVDSPAPQMAPYIIVEVPIP
jgi:hypothetical protein